MKQKIKKLLTCVGAVGALTMMLSVPVLADTKEDYDWSDKAAADVNTYANIRSGADINTERVGMLPAGAVVTVEGEENGWFQVSSRRDFRIYPGRFAGTCRGSKSPV